MLMNGGKMNVCRDDNERDEETRDWYEKLII